MHRRALFKSTIALLGMLPFTPRIASNWSRVRSNYQAESGRWTTRHQCIVVNQNTVRAEPQHQIRVRRNDECMMIAAEDVQVGDEIAALS